MMITYTENHPMLQRPIQTVTAVPTKPAKPLFSRREVRRLVAAMIG